MTPSSSPLILITWMAIALCLVGIGLLVRRGFGGSIVGTHEGQVSFWIGWVVLMFFLQIWHLQYRVDERPLVLAVLAAGVGMVLSWRDILSRVRRVSLSAWPAVIASALLALWLSNRALGGAQNGDSGLYHAPVVRWYSEYAVVAGIGNLNARYALNQSYFLFAALLDRGPFLYGSHHLVNGVLLLPLLMRAVLGMWRLFHRCGGMALEDLYYALFFPAGVDLALHINLTSPSPDIAVFVLGVVLCGQLLALVQRVQRKEARLFDLVVVALLAAGGFTLKLSLAGISATVLLIAIAAFVKGQGLRPGEGWRIAGALVAIAALAIGPWIRRNIWMSGYPFYPSLVAGRQVAWLVPKSWATHILPKSDWWWSALADPSAGIQRLVSFGWAERSIVMPLLVLVVVLVALPLLWRWQNTRRQALSFVLLLPPLVSLVFNALSASMARYVGPAAWLLAVQAVVLLCSRFTIESRRLRQVLALVCLLGWLPLVNGRPLLRRLNTFEPTVNPMLTQQKLPSGFLLNVPQRNQGCWYAKLPCSSDINWQLREQKLEDGSFWLLSGELPAQ